MFIQHYTGVSIHGIIEEIPISNIVHPSIMLRYKIRGILELSVSIKKDGLLQPIIVRPINSSFEIVAGNRRFQACKLLNCRKIPCHIIELDNKEAFEVSLIENVHRHTLDPIEEAHAFKKYVTDFGWGGVTQLSRRLSKSPAYICKRMKLLELPTNVLELISTSNLNVSTAEELLGINDNNRQSQLVSLIRKRKISSKSVRTIIRNEQEELNPSELSQNRTNTDQDTVLKAFDKSVISLKLAMFKLATVMESFRQNWIIYDILLQHKNMIHAQIDLLIRQKKRYKRFNSVSGYKIFRRRKIP
jgi:ParB family transcriptional regulator, chromosome partitioning protein